MVDFSKFSTKDLEYLKAQSLDKVSTEGLNELQKQLSGVPSDTTDKSIPYDLLVPPEQRVKPVEQPRQAPESTTPLLKQALKTPVAREAVSALDAAITAAAPIVTVPLGAWTGVAKGIYGGLTGKPYAQDAESAIVKGMQDLSYQPVTSWGEKTAAGMENLLDITKAAPTPMVGNVPSQVPSKTLFGANPRSLEFNAVPIKTPFSQAPMYIPTVASKLFKESKVNFEALVLSIKGLSLVSTNVCATCG